jgi:hypothetical protein
VMLMGPILLSKHDLGWAKRPTSWNDIKSAISEPPRKPPGSQGHQLAHASKPPGWLCTTSLIKTLSNQKWTTSHIIRSAASASSNTYHRHSCQELKWFLYLYSYTLTLHWIKMRFWEE